MQTGLLRCSGNRKHFSVGQRNGFFDDLIEFWLFEVDVVNAKSSISSFGANLIHNGFDQMVSKVDVSSIFGFGRECKTQVGCYTPAHSNVVRQEHFICTIGGRLNQPVHLAAIGKNQFLQRDVLGHIYSATKSSPNKASSYSWVFWCAWRAATSVSPSRWNPVCNS